MDKLEDLPPHLLERDGEGVLRKMTDLEVAANYMRTARLAREEATRVNQESQAAYEAAKEAWYEARAHEGRAEAILVHVAQGRSFESAKAEAETPHPMMTTGTVSAGGGGVAGQPWVVLQNAAKAGGAQ